MQKIGHVAVLCVTQKLFAPTWAGRGGFQACTKAHQEGPYVSDTRLAQPLPGLSAQCQATETWSAGCQHELALALAVLQGLRVLNTRFSLPSVSARSCPEPWEYMSGISRRCSIHCMCSNPHKRRQHLVCPSIQTPGSKSCVSMLRNGMELLCG
eukprot:scaffold150931_cov21-Tisochrysis_lutea.AAC.1